MFQRKVSSVSPLADVFCFHVNHRCVCTRVCGRGKRREGKGKEDKKEENGFDGKERQ